MEQKLIPDSPSITKVEPMFQVSNMFRPTSRNVMIFGIMMKTIGAGLITSGAGVVFANLYLGVGMILGGLFIAAASEGLILFTKEEPMSSLMQAAEEVKIEVESFSVPAQQASEMTNPNQPIEQSAE